MVTKDKNNFLVYNFRWGMIKPFTAGRCRESTAAKCCIHLVGVSRGVHPVYFVGQVSDPTR